MYSRRDFMARAAGGAILSLGAPLPAFWQRVAAAAEQRADQPALVVLELNGGNDGLNTVVPYADDIYHKSRPTLGLEPAKVLKLDDHVGLHPSLKELHKLWQDGQVRVVQNVGYPNPNRSHFRSMQIWHAGVLGTAPSAGWLGRATDANPALGRCHVGTEAVPLAVQGHKEPAASLPNLADYQLALDALIPAGAGAASDDLLEKIEQQMNSTRDLAGWLAKARSNLPATTPGSLEERLTTVRVLLESTSRFRIFYTVYGGFDTHVSQQFTHQELLGTVSTAVSKFIAELHRSKLDERVLVLIFSEFGRRLKENGQRGTDHGTAAPVLLVGKPVRGGVLGSAPNLADLELGDPRFKIDFRDVYATLLRRWLNIDPAPILGKRDESLALV